METWAGDPTPLCFLRPAGTVLHNLSGVRIPLESCEADCWTPLTPIQEAGRRLSNPLEAPRCGWANISLPPIKKAECQKMMLSNCGAGEDA